MTIISETNVPSVCSSRRWRVVGRRQRCPRGYAETGDQPYKQTLSGLDSGHAIDLVQSSTTTAVLGWLLVQDGQSTSAVAYDGLGSEFTAVSHLKASRGPTSSVSTSGIWPPLDGVHRRPGAKPGPTRTPSRHQPDSNR